MRRLVLGLLVGLCACAERDNPWDPANRSDMAQAALPAQPVPGPSSEVVLPDSASRDPANPYFANLQSAMSAVKPGDTLWIQGGRSYVLTTGLEMVLGGAAFHWVVIRSFGGEARIVDGDPGSISALLTLTGPGYVERRQLPSDRRFNGLFLSRAGQSLLAQMNEAQRQHEGRISAQLSGEEQHELVRLLRKLEMISRAE